MTQDDVTATGSVTSAPQDGASPDSTTGKPRRRGPGRPFVAGDPRANTRGRPKKGESFAERYRKEIERHAEELIRGHVERAKGRGVVASKEFALAAAYVMGRPVQPYVVETQDAPGWTLMQRLAARGVLPTVVEGEARLLPAADDAPASEAEGR